jgi:hypothetical protein
MMGFLKEMAFTGCFHVKSSKKRAKGAALAALLALKPGR